MPSEQIYKDLKRQILNGERQAGDSLVETTLAKEYEASRLHVKSAFQRLEAEMLVCHEENKGYFVAEISDDLMEEIIDIRQALEGVVVARVIQVASDEELRQLVRLGERIAVFIEHEMYDDALEEVRQFYQLLYDLSRYDRVVAILDTYSDYISLIREKSAVTQAEHDESVQNLKRLLKAMRARDTKTALYELEQRNIHLITADYPSFFRR